MKRTITQDIISWSKNFLEKPNKDLGGKPVCPFAKKTREENKLRIVETKESEDFLNKLVDECKSFGDNDVVIVACDDIATVSFEFNVLDFEGAILLVTVASIFTLCPLKFAPKSNVSVLPVGEPDNVNIASPS